MKLKDACIRPNGSGSGKIVALLLGCFCLVFIIFNFARSSTPDFYEIKTKTQHILSPPQSDIPVINIFYSNRDYGKTDRLESVKREKERSDTSICPLFQKISMSQARQWNAKVYFAEEGTACKSWMESNNISHIQLPEDMIKMRFEYLHKKFPELKEMNAEFTYAYSRQWDFLYVANLLGASSFCFIDGDVMTYTSALTLASHMQRNGFGAAYCLYWPRANNLFGYFTAEALEDMIRYLESFPDGHSPWNAGDMGWLKNYAALSLSLTDEEAGFKVQRIGNFTAKFKIGDTCSYWEGGVGADVIYLDQDWMGEFKILHKTFKQIVWIHNRPFFIRSNDSAAIPVWHMHFQGIRKVMMQNYLRWSTVERNCYDETSIKEMSNSGMFDKHCECITYHCRNCYVKTKCDFSEPVSVDQQKQLGRRLATTLS